MNIEWTLCGERMPHDSKKLKCIIHSMAYNYVMAMSVERMHFMANLGMILTSSTRWTEFTQEKWEFLNR